MLNERTRSHVYSTSVSRVLSKPTKLDDSTVDGVLNQTTEDLAAMDSEATSEALILEGL
jgi:hypothetical protein